MKLTSLKNKQSITEAEVECESPSNYIVSYKASDRGRHELSVKVNGQPISGSPFRVYIQHPPQRLGRPVKVIRGIIKPFRPATTESSKLVVSSEGGVFMIDSTNDDKLKKLSIFELNSDDTMAKLVLHPCGVTVDNDQFIFVNDYVTHKVLKLSSSGEVLKSVGGGDSKNPGELNWPNGLAIKEDKLFVCDRYNHRIQAFDLDLNCINKSQIAIQGSGEGQLDQPTDIAFDSVGNMYVVDFGNDRVQVFSPSGSFLRTIGQPGTGPGELKGLVSIHVDCNSVYVTEYENRRVSVFTMLGDFVASFGVQDSEEEKFSSPWGITMDCDGYLYVCDTVNNCVYKF